MTRLSFARGRLEISAHVTAAAPKKRPSPGTKERPATSRSGHARLLPIGGVGPTGMAKLHLPTRINAPAAMARTAMRVPSPEKLRLSRGMSPVTMSQIPNNNTPRLLVNVIENSYGEGLLTARTIIPVRDLSTVNTTTTVRTHAPGRIRTSD